MKELNLSFDIRIPLERHDVHWIEDELLKLREKTFLEVFRQILVRIEAEALEGIKRCQSCGEVLVHNGHEFKRIRTLMGSIRIARVRLRCQSCGNDTYPLDEAIGLEAGDGTTLGVRERALWAAIELSYEKSASFLRKFTGLEVSCQKIYDMAIDEGRRIEKWEERRREGVFGEAKAIEEKPEKRPKVLYIQVEATGVNDLLPP